MKNKCKCQCFECSNELHCGSIKCGEEYFSPTKAVMCNNDFCHNNRQSGSKFCSDCSYNFNKNKYDKRTN